MDDIVRAALKKWPSVPACRGWLGLDARGNWYMRDDRVQAAGPFPRIKGSLLRHEKLREFIHRNYESDADGAWFFQNGPQRVYVELEAAPLIYGIERVAGGGFALEAHTGARVKRVIDTWLDESGRLFVSTDIGFGLLRSPDMNTAADAVLQGAWAPQSLPFAHMPARFGYRLSPHAASALT